MRLTISEFLKREYGPESRPTPKTIRARIAGGTFPYQTEKEGGRWYIIVDRPICHHPDPKVRELFDKVTSGATA